MDILSVVIGVGIVELIALGLIINGFYSINEKYKNIINIIGEDLNMELLIMVDEIEDDVFKFKSVQEEYAKIILDKLDVIVDVMYDKIDAKFEEHENFIREENNRL